jgi:hypothetical protein
MLQNKSYLSRKINPLSCLFSNITPLRERWRFAQYVSHPNDCYQSPWTNIRFLSILFIHMFICQAVNSGLYSYVLLLRSLFMLIPIWEWWTLLSYVLCRSKLCARINLHSTEVGQRETSHTRRSSWKALSPVYVRHIYESGQVLIGLDGLDQGCGHKAAQESRER